MPAAYVPAGHDVAVYEQVDLPATEKLPLAQGRHTSEEVEPMEVENVPAAQLVQEDAPLPLYFPAPQVAQVLLEVALVVLLALPAAQLVQDEAPAKELYVPALQVVQNCALVAPTTAPYLPAVQLEQITALGALQVPAAHGSGAVEHCGHAKPAGQGSDVVGSSGQYPPGGQTERHAVTPGPELSLVRLSDVWNARYAAPAGITVVKNGGLPHEAHPAAHTAPPSPVRVPFAV